MSRQEERRAERIRVLRMLDENKISVEECAELLDSLDSPRQATTAGWRWKTLLILGAIAVACGFFLPWFRYTDRIADKENLFEAEARINGHIESLGRVVSADDLKRAMAEKWSGGKPIQGIPNIVAVLSKPIDVTVYGPDLKHGLGWIMLALALATVMISLSNPWRRFIQKSYLLALGFAGIAAFLVGYLYWAAPRFASMGLAVAALGIMFQGFGVMMMARTARGVEF